MPYPLLSMDEADCGYQQAKILDQTKLSLVPGSRIGLLGRMVPVNLR